MANGLDCKLVSDNIVVNRDLRISFQRTIRVPDNQQVSYLPPSLGTFPLSKVSQYATKLTDDIVAKGGLFFPMYRESSCKDSEQ
jgi:hypothetical protein